MISAVAALAIAGLAALPAVADEQCRWEKCDFNLMPNGASLATLCDCYKKRCGEETVECACEQARDKPGRALDSKGRDVGTMKFTINPLTLPAKPGARTNISVEIDLSEGRTDVDASFRVAVSSGKVTPASFPIKNRRGTSPPIVYETAADAKPGDVIVSVFGGWVVILLGQATGTVYGGKACLALN
jgi:hypothetical protein